MANFTIKDESDNVFDPELIFSGIYSDHPYTRTWNAKDDMKACHQSIGGLGVLGS